LTPTSFRDGLYKMGYRYYPETYAIGGGYGPGDPSYPDDFNIVWWDPSATDPYQGYPGAFRAVANGKRFKLGEIPTGDIALFRDGVTGVGN
jgi:hypothetical protein